MITESKLKNGTLTLDLTSYATQATNVKLTPSVDEQGEAVETLDGSTSGADETTKWTLGITAIQDFDDPAGLTRYLFDNAGTDVPFSWAPNANGTSFDGTVTLRAPEIGGAVNQRLEHELEMACVGAVVPTWAP